MEGVRKEDLLYLKLAVKNSLVSEDQARDIRRQLQELEAAGNRRKARRLMVDQGLLTAKTAAHLQELIKGYLHDKADLAARQVEIDGYEIIERIGAGAMGAVFKARQLDLDRPVAIKILLPDLSLDSIYVERFLREARSAAAINHPNIVQAFKCDRAGDIYYLAMEFVDGRNLKEILEEDGPLPEREALRITTEVARALEEAAKVGIVHRDIKPANIMVASSGQVKLCDLGLAKCLKTEDSSLTQEGRALGTPYYMSPEQATDLDGVDSRSDIYGLGATLFHVLTGSPPFRAPTAQAVLALHLAAPVPDPRSLVPGLSRAVACLIFKMMAKHPNDRYQQPSELVADAEAILSGKLGSVKAMGLALQTPKPGSPVSNKISITGSTGSVANLMPFADFGGSADDRPSRQRTSRRLGNARDSSRPKPAVLAAGTAFALLALSLGYLVFSTPDASPDPAIITELTDSIATDTAATDPDSEIDLEELAQRTLSEARRLISPREKQRTLQAIINKFGGTEAASAAARQLELLESELQAGPVVSDAPPDRPTPGSELAPEIAPDPAPVSEPATVAKPDSETVAVKLRRETLSSLKSSLASLQTSDAIDQARAILASTTDPDLRSALERDISHLDQLIDLEDALVGGLEELRGQELSFTTVAGEAITGQLLSVDRKQMLIAPKGASESRAVRLAEIATAPRLKLLERCYGESNAFIHELFGIYLIYQGSFNEARQMLQITRSLRQQANETTERIDELLALVDEVSELYGETDTPMSMAAASATPSDDAEPRVALSRPERLSGEEATRAGSPLRRDDEPSPTTPTPTPTSSGPVILVNGHPLSSEEAFILDNAERIFDGNKLAYVGAGSLRLGYSFVQDRKRLGKDWSTSSGDLRHDAANYTLRAEGSNQVIHKGLFGGQRAIEIHFSNDASLLRNSSFKLILSDRKGRPLVLSEFGQTLTLTDGRRVRKTTGKLDLSQFRSSGGSFKVRLEINDDSVVVLVDGEVQARLDGVELPEDTRLGFRYDHVNLQIDRIYVEGKPNTRWANQQLSKQGTGDRGDASGSRRESRTRSSRRS